MFVWVPSAAPPILSVEFWDTLYIYIYTRWRGNKWHYCKTDDYLCYKEPKIPYNFFLILYLTNYLSLKFRTNGNIKRRVALLCRGKMTTSCLRSQTDPFALFTALPRLSHQNEHVMLFDFI